MFRRIAYVVAAQRTPIGLYNGGLASLTAPQLGAITVDNLLFKVPNLPVELIDELIFGNALQGNIGQNPTNQIKYYCNSRLNDNINTYTINTGCTSGAKAITLAAQSIELGHNNIVIAGGMESLSNCPYYLGGLRNGINSGNHCMSDGILKDNMDDITENDKLVGWYADQIGKKGMFRRKHSDEYIIESFLKVQKAYDRSIFDFEMSPITIKRKAYRGEDLIVSRDESCWKLNPHRVESLPLVYDKTGILTIAGTAQLGDGAASVLLVSEDILKDYNLTPIAKILSYCDFNQESSDFIQSNMYSMELGIEKGGLNRRRDFTQQDFFEVHESFSITGLYVRHYMDIHRFNFNMYGGAIALGHPIAASGPRQLCTLLSLLKENSGRYGVSCIGNNAGGAVTIVVEHMM